MSVAEILKEQNAWLEQAGKTIVLSRPSEAQAAFAEDLRAKGKARIEVRIAALEAQRDAAAKRFDAAIAEAKEELKQLDGELNLPKAPASETAKPPASDTAKPPASETAKPRAAGAAPSRRSKAASPKAKKKRGRSRRA